MSFGRIIVGYDGGDSSRDALKLASLFHRTPDAALLLAHVYTHAPRVDVFADAQAHLPYGSRAEFHSVRAPAVADGLLGLAEREHADLIVVGSPPRRSSRVLHSPTTIGERLLHSSPCAVAIAPRDFALDPDPAFRVLGVAFDDTPESQRAVTCVREIALAAHATVRLIGVAEPVSGPSVGMAAMSGWSASEGTLRERLRRELEEQAEELPPELRAQVILADGHPAEELVKRAGVLSLLVMGSRGFGPVRRALLGSVAAPVVRAAPCPLLVLPRGARLAPIQAAAGTAV